MNASAPDYLRNLFWIRDNVKNLCGMNKLVIPKVNTTTYGLKSVRYTAAKACNSIPVTMRTLTSTKAFKKAIRQLSLTASNIWCRVVKVLWLSVFSFYCQFCCCCCFVLFLSFFFSRHDSIFFARGLISPTNPRLNKCYCTVLCCIVLYCIVLYCFVSMKVKNSQNSSEHFSYVCFVLYSLYLSVMFHI